MSLWRTAGPLCALRCGARATHVVGGGKLLMLCCEPCGKRAVAAEPRAVLYPIPKRQH